MSHHHHGDHDHGHHHHHHHDDGQRALGLALALNGAFLVVEVGIGLSTGSLALLSDATHMLSDVAALVLAMVAARLAQRPAGSGATFGWQRAEVVGAGVNGLALAAAAVWIVVEAVQRLLHGPPEVSGLPILIVGAIGLLINVLSAVGLRHAGDDLNLRAAFAHMVADALGSAGAILAALAVMAGWPAADPWVSLVIAALVGWSALDVLQRAGAVLLQLPPPGFDVAGTEAALRALPGVTGLHDLRVWSIDGRGTIVSGHLVSDSDPDTVRAAADAMLHDRGVHDATLQIERPGGAPCCRRDGHAHA